MIYRNTKTGVIFDSPCDISGGDWVKEEDLIERIDQKEEEIIEDPEELLEEEPEGLPEDATIAEMKDYAEEHGIDLGDAKKKDEIAAVLASAR